MNIWWLFLDPFVDSLISLWRHIDDSDSLTTLCWLFDDSEKSWRLFIDFLIILRKLLIDSLVTLWYLFDSMTTFFRTRFLIWQEMGKRGKSMKNIQKAEMKQMGSFCIMVFYLFLSFVRIKQYKLYRFQEILPCSKSKTWNVLG